MEQSTGPTIKTLCEEVLSEAGVTGEKAIAIIDQWEQLRKTDIDRTVPSTEILGTKGYIADSIAHLIDKPEGLEIPYGFGRIKITNIPISLLRANNELPELMEVGRELLAFCGWCSPNAQFPDTCAYVINPDMIDLRKNRPQWEPLLQALAKKHPDWKFKF